MSVKGTHGRALANECGHLFQTFSLLKYLDYKYTTLVTRQRDVVVVRTALIRKLVFTIILIAREGSINGVYCELMFAFLILLCCALVMGSSYYFTDSDL